VSDSGGRLQRAKTLLWNTERIREDDRVAAVVRRRDRRGVRGAAPV
jgi:hypothetical protein